MSWNCKKLKYKSITIKYNSVIIINEFNVVACWSSKSLSKIKIIQKLKKIYSDICFKVVITRVVSCCLRKYKTQKKRKIWLMIKIQRLVFFSEYFDLYGCALVNVNNN